jgi:glycosyltransferase involved in cell wall biosynthesis
MQQPMLSIIIPINSSTGDNPDLFRPILEALNSGTSTEVIVVHDNTATNMAGQILQSYPTVKVIASNGNGIAAAMNTGLAAASGKYINYLDSASIPDSNYYEAKLSRLERDSNCDACYGSYTLNRQNDSTAQKHKLYPLYTDGTRYAREHMVNYLGGTYMPQSVIVWRKDFLLRRKGHNQELNTNYDEELFVRSIVNGLRITAVKDDTKIKVSSINIGENLQSDEQHLRELLKTRKKMFTDLRKYSFEEDDCFLALGTFLFNKWTELRQTQPDLAIDFLEYGKRVCWPVPVQGSLAYRSLARLLGPEKATEMMFPLPKTN